MNSSNNLTRDDSTEVKNLYNRAGIATGATLIALLMVAAFLGNLLTCYVHCKKATLRTPTNISIGMLSVSDILMAVLVMPFSLVSFLKGKWCFSPAICTFTAFLTQIRLGVTFVQMGLIAVIRYLCVVRPSLHRHLGQNTSFFSTFATWMIYAIIVIVPIFVDSGYGSYRRERNLCHLSYKQKTISEQLTTVRLILGIIIAFVIFVVYSRVFCYINHHNQAVLPNLQQGNHLQVQEVKITRTLAFVVLGFAFCWTPSTIVEIIKRWIIRELSKFPALIIFSQTITIFTSSAINPIIYGITNRRFRKEYTKLFRRLWLS